MMDRVDFELCLNVEELAARYHHDKLEVSSTCEQDESTNTPQSNRVNGAETGMVRSWGQIDQTLDGSSNNEVPTRKRTRISASGSWRGFHDCDMDYTQEDCDMRGPQDATLVKKSSDYTQQLKKRVGDEHNTAVSADYCGHEDSSSILDAGRQPVPDAVGTSLTRDIDNERYIQEQSRLPLTPLLLGPSGSNYYSTTRNGTLISPSHNRPEKTAEKAHFTIYEDPEEFDDTDMDTMDTDMNMDIDHDDDSDDSEGPQQWNSYGHLSDDKENTDENYGDNDDDGNEQGRDLRQLNAQARTGTQTEMRISFDEAETESDTETIIQEHALTRHIVQDTAITTRMHERGESDESVRATPEREQDGEDNIVDYYAEDDESTFAVSPRGHRRDIITSDNGSNDDYNNDDSGDTVSAIFPRREIHPFPNCPLDTPSLNPGGLVLSGLLSQTGSTAGEHLQPNMLGHSILTPSSSSYARRYRRSYRPRAFN